MNSYSLFKFAITREVEVNGVATQRVYQLEIAPGSPWDEIFDVLGEFTSEMEKLKLAAQETEKLSQATTIEAEGSNPTNSPVLEAELVEK